MIQLFYEISFYYIKENKNHHSCSEEDAWSYRSIAQGQSWKCSHTSECDHWKHGVKTNPVTVMTDESFVSNAEFLAKSSPTGTNLTLLALTSRATTYSRYIKADFCNPEAAADSSAAVWCSHCCVGREHLTKGIELHTDFALFLICALTTQWR